MPRCGDCNKFVSLDSDIDPDVRVEVDENGSVSGTVTIVNQCGECSTDMQTAEFEIDMDFSDEYDTHLTACGKDTKKEDHELEVVFEPTRTDHYQKKDKNGKPIKSARYQKHFYGAEGEVIVQCKCGEEFREQWSDSIQASGMDEA